MMIKETVLNFFPAPTFLTMPAAGISMSDTHIRAIQFRRDHSIEKYIQLPLPPGVISAGRFNNQDEIIAALKTLKEKLGTVHVRASLPEEKAYLFELDIPFVEPQEVRGAIEFKLEENVPFPADQVVFDYAVTPIQKEKKELHTVVSVLPTKFVSIYVDMFAAAGLIPYAFEIESQAVARALLPKNDQRGYVIVQSAPQKMSLSIVSQGLVRFTSTSVFPTENTEDVGKEIKKVLVYWEGRENTPGYVPLEKILICGDNLDKSFASQINVITNMPTEFGNVWTNAFDIHTSVPEISFMDSLAYATAVGLALPSDLLL